jgi:hypothetical protein
MGASIDYVLKAPVTGPVVLTVSDAQGAIVRRYSSEDKLPPTDLGKLRTAPEWTPPSLAPSAAPGTHRFVWSLRYPAPASMAEGNPYADGVWAPPGRYSVELTAGGQRLSQPLTIVPDPRITLPAEAYARQFALARRIESAAVRVAAAVDEAETLHGSLGPRASAASGAVRRRIAEVDSRVQALTGPRFGAPPTGAPPPGIKTLRSLAARSSVFAAAVDGADAAPTPDAEAGFARFEPEVAATLAAWETVKAAARVLAR